MKNPTLKITTFALACTSSLLYADPFGVEMPNKPVSGVQFPTAETTINSWVFAKPPKTGEIHRHAWGIWAGLTTKTNTEKFGISDALIYQTWLSPSGIIDLMEGKDSSPILELRTPRQHLRGGNGPSLLAPNPKSDNGIQIDYAIAEVVAYSPSAARHTFSNQLLYTETLDTLLEQGYTEMPPFPANSVNIKPVYKLITSNELNQVGGKSLYAMPAWPGTPDVSNWTAAQKKLGYPNKLWGECVYIDVNMEGPSNAKGVDKTCANPGSDNTYSLDDFISIPITSGDIAYFRDLTKGQTPISTNLKEGDTLILVGMHVTSRETERWTWQTFWWAPDPKKPNAPSSSLIAAAQPSELSYQAGHYAMAVAYSMLEPAQPLIGGSNNGALVPAYNPHLEAGFGTGVFGKTEPVSTPLGVVTTDLGVQSNCMSCHGYAAYGKTSTPYVSNFYVPRNDSLFEGNLTTDFAWSIPDEAVSKNKK